MVRAVPSEPDFPGMEEEILAGWERNDVFRRSLEQRAGAQEFVFYEGPPTANGRPGLHHVWARVYKDLFCRYQTMQGHLVRRRAGWDTHGLPVEVEVEKALGLKDKREIETFGIEEFTRRCRESVQTYVSDWEALTRRIAFWVDTSDAYWTMDSSYVESVWWHLTQLWERGLLYEDVKVVPYCPRCGTALSSHEMGQPDVYRDVEDATVYVRFPLVSGAPADSLVVWTTTPWTLPSNTGVAVHPDLTYAVVDGQVVAEDLVEAVFGEGARPETTISGRDLVGLHYERPFNVVDLPPGYTPRVVAAHFVSATEGTGLVHLAPAFGEVDREVGRASGLAVLNPVDPDGRFTPEAKGLAGRAVHEAAPELIADLDARGLLLRAERVVHAYPHCWRCGTALINWGKPSWYVATSTKREELQAENEQVVWRPEHTKHGRFGEWLENNVDWALSRDRFWGTPLPVWRCQEGHTRCVPSLDALSRLAGRDVTRIDPHRPAIDAVEFECPDCGGVARRVEPVIDAWFDSGSMPAAQWGYPHCEGSEDAFRFPADFIAEAVDQTRGWFYSLLAVNTLVFGRAPYRAVLSLGHIVDADGRKMSKSLGNVIDPWAILATRGADPLRWWMFRQGSPWTSTRTSFEAIDAATSDTLMTLWNTWSFHATYARLDGFEPSDTGVPEPAARSALDRWLRSRVHHTVRAVAHALDEYQPLAAAVLLGDLVDDISNWYVRRSRPRFWRTDVDRDDVEARRDSLAAHASLHEALVTIATMLAPLCPFLADRMWRDLTEATDDQSVHLERWPECDIAALDPILEAEMEQVRRLASLGRAARSEAGVRVRQPLRRAVVVLGAGAPRLLTDVLAPEINVDDVEVASSAAEVLDVELAPNFRALGPRLGPRVQQLRAALAAVDARVAAERLRVGEPIEVILGGERVELGPDDVEVRVRPREGFAVSHHAAEAVALDLTLDDDLRRRGLARDVVRQVQDLRRRRGLELSDRIQLRFSGVDDLAPVAALVAREVLATEVGFEPGDGDGEPLELDDYPVARVWLTRVTTR